MTPMSPNRLWAALAVDTCIRREANHFFVAPGSRCTPLTLAVAQHAEAHVTGHFDERGLAFAALGYARATGKAGIFICTSGTAVANAMPAVVEAAMDNVPMVLLTADRPPELRQTGANQTIDQQKIFGERVRWFFDMPCPTAAITPSFVRSQLDYALQQARTGPVHLNWMFREPFGASDEPVDMAAYPLAETAVTGNHQSKHVIPGGDTLVIVGTCRTCEARAATALANRIGAPILGDVTSGIRTIPLDLVLRDPQGEQLPSPTSVIHIGGRIVSKHWLRFLERRAPDHLIHLTARGTRINPSHAQIQSIEGQLDSICQGIELNRPSSTAFQKDWETAGRRCLDVVSHVVGDEVQLTEPAIASALAELMPSDHGLFVGNSMPVRDVDRYCFWPSDRNIVVGANRGASGIDGLIASASGFALGLQRPTTLLLGDLSALHDLNSLALLQQATTPLIVVIVNNHGGGIFDVLPVAQQTRYFEQYFTTPHQLDFGRAAQMFGLSYQRPADLPAFRQTYAAAVGAKAATIIELSTDRAANLRLRKTIEDCLR